jgi:hypothetical protein
MSVTARPLGRQELLSWLNEITHSDIAKVQPSLPHPAHLAIRRLTAAQVEHCCDGVACLKLLDTLHPGKVSFKKARAICARMPGVCVSRGNR